MEPSEAGSALEELIRVIARTEVQRELEKATARPPPKYVSIATYAEARSISRSTVRNAIRSGRLPAIRVGSAVRVAADTEIGTAVEPVSRVGGDSPATRAQQILSRAPRRSLGAGVVRLHVG